MGLLPLAKTRPGELRLVYAIDDNDRDMIVHLRRKAETPIKKSVVILLSLMLLQHAGCLNLVLSWMPRSVEDRSTSGIACVVMVPSLLASFSMWSGPRPGGGSFPRRARCEAPAPPLAQRRVVSQEAQSTYVSI